MAFGRIDPPALSEKQIHIFWSNVDKSPGFGPWGNCWKWTRKPNFQGYGKVTAKQGDKMRTMVPHRISLFLTTGGWPPEETLHDCDTPLCVNPHHLRPGTRKENVADAAQRGRMAQGVRNCKAKLTDDDVKEILADRASPVKEQAKKYNVTVQSIYHIHKRKTWKHI